MKRNARLRIWAASIAAAILPLVVQGNALAREYLIAGTKPNLLFLLDTQARKVARQYKVPGDGPPSTICVSSDGRIAYVLTDHGNAVSGINLDSGKQIFRAEFSTPDTKIRSLAGMAVSRDGKELFVEESVAKILPDEYQVQPSRIAVYETNAGLKAQPARTFETPRRVSLLMTSVDGKVLYALGWDLYSFDPATGKLLKTDKVFNWDRPNSSNPDFLSFWPVSEQSEIFASPYYYSRTDLPQDKPESQKTGLMVLDLRTGKFRMTDFENTSALIFSSVINPKNPNEAMGAYTTLSRINLGDQPRLEKRIDLDHTYYVVDISEDGSECYVGGNMADVGVYSTKTMKKIGDIKLPGGGDMAVAMIEMVHRP